MKRALFALALLAILPARSALAHDADACGMSFSCCDPPVRWAQRHTLEPSRLTITTTDGEVNLVLTDDVLALQLSDHVLHKIQRKLRNEEDSDDNVLAHSIKLAVLSGVRALLDHSAEVAIDDVRDVDYQHGRLRLITRNGQQLFQNTDVDDRNVMEGFSEHDARAFVREFRRAKSGSH